MLGRRSLLLGSVVGALTACADARPPALITTTKGPYAGRAIEGAFTLPDVTLTDTAGQPYNMRTSPTTPIVVLFFGYSNCPDVCSGVLSDLATSRRRLEDRSLAARITLMCVTTDPARDTPAVLGAYLKRIDPGYVGLTGPLPTIMQAGASLGIAIEEGKKLPSGGYEVDHGTQVLAFGADKKSRVVWTTGTTIASYKADFTRLAANA